MPSPSERIEFARRLRRESTDAERVLWEQLRRRQVRGLKFRRQAPVGRYVADFLCIEAKLIVEVDDIGHADRVDHDSRRSIYLEACGFSVLRFSNGDVLWRLNEVMGSLYDWLHRHRRLG